MEAKAGYGSQYTNWRRFKEGNYINKRNIYLKSHCPNPIILKDKSMGPHQDGSWSRPWKICIPRIWTLCAPNGKSLVRKGEL